MTIQNLKYEIINSVDIKPSTACSIVGIDQYGPLGEVNHIIIPSTPKKMKKLIALTSDQHITDYLKYIFQIYETRLLRMKYLKKRNYKLFYKLQKVKKIK